jgi:DNA polymerase-3 subunit alpha
VQAVEALVAERTSGGPFADLFDLAARAGGRILNRRLLEALIKAGTLDRLHANRRRLIGGIDLALRYGAAHVEQATSDQASLFGGLLEQPELPKPRLPEVEDLPELERLQQEFEALGCYLTAHPLEGYRAGLMKLGVTPSDQLAQCGGLRVKLAGVVLGKQERSTARSRFAFVQLSDPAGVYEVTLFAELLGRVRELLESNQPLLVEGDVRLDGDLVKVQATALQALDLALANGGRRADSRIEIRLADATAAGGLADLLGPHGDGSARVRVVLPLDTAEEVAIELGDEHRLALVRRIDLERRAGVVSVVDL